MPPTLTPLLDPGALAIVIAGTVLATVARCGWRDFGTALRSAGGLLRGGFATDANRKALALAVSAIQRDGPRRADPALPPDRTLAMRDTPEFMALAHEVREALADGHH